MKGIHLYNIGGIVNEFNRIRHENSKKYYKSGTYNHALRVTNYVAENKIIPEEKMYNCIALAIMHDLLEDTLYSFVDWSGG